jgi:hypothetical protein
VSRHGKALPWGISEMLIFFKMILKERSHICLRQFLLLLREKYLIIPLGLHLISQIFFRNKTIKRSKKCFWIFLSNSAHITGDNENYFVAHNTAASYYRSTNNPALSLLHSDSASFFNSKLAAQRDLKYKYKIEMAVENEKVKEREKHLR